MKLIKNPGPPHQCEVKPRMTPAEMDRLLEPLRSVLGAMDLQPGAIVECDCGKRWEYKGTESEYDRFQTEVWHLFRVVSPPPPTAASIVDSLIERRR